MSYDKESDFERDLIEILTSSKGWSEHTLYKPTEEDLLDNWADILYKNNRDIASLGDYPLTRTEVKQLLDQIEDLRTPVKLNAFIKGPVTIVRDNKADIRNFGKSVSLYLYDKKSIGGGSSVYQIAEQPIFRTNNKSLNDKRGDITLLINGMPLIHVELKRTGVPVSKAYEQIKLYHGLGVFTGFFSLVQIFVAMNPEDGVYFANPGSAEKFNQDFAFHWGDFNNEIYKDWKKIAESILSIPAAHQLIGYYTIADATDNTLKVMRSYQYHAANQIITTVQNRDWKDNSGEGKGVRGGFIWHTTGSGKTMTSFKSAQLIAGSDYADKVIFLMDRVELGVQSLQEYRNFAEDDEEVQATENTKILVAKLKSNSPLDKLIVTSIQKMSNIDIEHLDDLCSLKDLNKIREKRIVFIVDEAHRSVFGDMLDTIKKTFDNAMFFGFTGTPIMDENQKKGEATSSIFGKELHRYSIADGIRDHNVLGFDIYRLQTFKDSDLRVAVALKKANAKNVFELDDKSQEIYDYYMDKSAVPMVGYKDAQGNYFKGIEDYVPKSQYHTFRHQEAVVNDIIKGFDTLSRGKTFHAIFAASSIQEAIEYYRFFKKLKCDLKVTALFDPSVDYQSKEVLSDESEDVFYDDNNNDAILDGGMTKQGFAQFKEEALKEIVDDYNAMFGTNFSDHATFKKDIASRLAHKNAYATSKNPKDHTWQLDLLIVVDQMLTGYDSKYINTLYLDKVIKYELIIQALSRTNRLFDKHKKPFGIIRYYRYTNTMKRNIDEAIKLYSGDKATNVFVAKLGKHLQNLNEVFLDIKQLFESSGIENFSKLPEDVAEKGKFAKLFNQFVNELSGAKIQGFLFSKDTYEVKDIPPITSVTVEFTENDYATLLQRYKELMTSEGSKGPEELPFDIDTSITEIDDGIIDSAYMTSCFKKYYYALNNLDAKEIEKVLNDLHRSFAHLSVERQKFAEMFLHDVISGNIKIVDDSKEFMDYIVEYETRSQNDAIREFSKLYAVDEQLLRELIAQHPDDHDINEYGRFDNIVNKIDYDKAKEFLTKVMNVPNIPNIKLRPLVRSKVRDFVLTGGKSFEKPE